MIEIIDAQRCTGCNICVQVCPTHVFEKAPQGSKGSAPTIARQSDCQTCFMCELYCPEDALFVAPQADEAVDLPARAPQVQALLGSYRKAVGWTRSAEALPDTSYELLKRAH
ncbi:4Fe-4S dicluster domain-containing protein [Hylemonella gracilis]|uniref:Electron transport complex, RnfABCDGE type, B n=1 Tax=Hylemonella gracilis ATCC 19624 TaxID=887062 RepID=F3KUL0_9BURK|nr:ferredoxin family protein [Hylemonella gracilis]EGI76587.1 electron transport complex, RnfABCDGE type, B [Hylemonella gracilis ATCC 19624]